MNSTSGLTEAEKRTMIDDLPVDEQYARRANLPKSAEVKLPKGMTEAEWRQKDTTSE